MKRRLVMVTGTARSATLYIANVLRKVGLKIGHEYVDADGTASHFFASGHITYPVLKKKHPKGRCAHVGERRSDYTFDHVFHQVRHPLKVVDSARWTGVHAQLLAACNIEDPGRGLARIVRYCYGWNLLCESQAEWRYRIEDIDTIFPEMCERLGIPVRPVPNVDRTMHHHRRWDNPIYARTETGKFTVLPYRDAKAFVQAAPPLTWADLEAADGPYTEQLKAMAQRYGYEL